MAFWYRNSHGHIYYLNSKVVKLKNGHEQQIYYFSRDLRSTAVDNLPLDRDIVESSQTGLPVLKRV